MPNLSRKLRDYCSFRMGMNDAGGIMFMKEEANTALTPHYASITNRVGKIENGSKLKTQHQ